MKRIGDVGVIEDHMGFGERLNGNLRRYVIETTSYNFSTSISSNLVNAMAMRFMGFNVVELGVLTTVRMLSVTLGSIIALPILYRFREHRLKLWLIFGSINRIGWALTIFTILLPFPLNSIALLTLLSIIQVSGAIAGIAATDTLADMVKPSIAGRFFGVVTSINNITALLALAFTLLAFRILDVEIAYWTLYLVALGAALISTAALATLKDTRVLRGERSSMLNPIDIALRYKSVAMDTPRSKSYLAIMTSFHFAVNIPAAFWDYYIMRVLGGDEMWITVKNVSMLASKALALRLWASMIDSIGARRSLMLSIASTTPIPVMYYHATDILSMTGVSVYSSVAWAPWDVSTTLYTYYLVPEDKRPAFISLQNITSNAAATLASSVGTWIASHLGLYYVFLASTMLRSTIALISVKTLPELEIQNTPYQVGGRR